MTARDLTLNIAVNLGRIARWTTENKTSRIPLFWEETENYFKDLRTAPKSKRFVPTADDLFTWANILAHRAKLT